MALLEKSTLAGRLITGEPLVTVGEPAAVEEYDTRSRTVGVSPVDIHGVSPVRTILNVALDPGVLPADLGDLLLRLFDLVQDLLLDLGLLLKLGSRVDQYFGPVHQLLPGGGIVFQLLLHLLNAPPLQKLLLDSLDNWIICHDLTCAKNHRANKENHPRLPYLPIHQHILLNFYAHLSVG